jgi:hypothetical protein
VTPIRPTASSLAQPGQIQGGQDRAAAKLAAQKAFFAALGKAGAATGPEPAAAAPAAAATQVAAPSTTAAAGEAPRKIPRPGSLIDIRV